MSYFTYPKGGFSFKHLKVQVKLQSPNLNYHKQLDVSGSDDSLSCSSSNLPFSSAPRSLPAADLRIFFQALDVRFW